MRAIKANKEYVISEQEKKRYIDDGYDIIDDDGKIIAYGRGKTVPYEQYKKVVDELETLKSGTIAVMTAEELKTYAESNGIDIGQATTQEGILKKIKAAKEV